MRKEGMSYLSSIIGPIVQEIAETPGSFEVDPSRREDEQELAENTKRLREVAKKMLDTVLASKPTFPPMLRVLCKELHQQTMERFPDQADMGIISGFIFLRFICPFIIAPGAFGFLTQNPPSANATRGLILVSKTVQNVANGIEFGMKEPYMVPLNSLVHSYVNTIQSFFEDLMDLKDITLSISPGTPSLEEEDKVLPELHLYMSANKQKMRQILNEKAGAAEGTDCPLAADLLKVLETLGMPVAPPSDKPGKMYSEEQPQDAGSTNREKLLNELFLLNTTDTIVAEYACSLDGKIPVHGQCYVSENYLCFYASVFGFVTREVIPWWEVVSIEKEPNVSNSVELTKSDWAVFVFFNLKKCHKTYEVFKKLWKQRRARPMGGALPRNIVSRSESSTTRKTIGGGDAPQTQVLTARDWELFQKSAKQVTYQQNQHILRQGQPSHSLFQIARGSVRVEIMKQNAETQKQEQIVVGHMRAGEMFGEISFLDSDDSDSAVASASVVADEEIDMYIINHSSIYELLRTDPGLAARFYKWLAISLGRRVRSKVIPINKPKEREESTVGMSKISDSKFQKLFGINDPHQILLSQYPASLQRKMAVHGFIYISKNYLCFHARVLGVAFREVVQFKEVSAIVKDSKTIEVTATDDKDEEKTLAITPRDSLDKIYDEITGFWRAIKGPQGSRARMKSSSTSTPGRSLPRKADTLTDADFKLFLEVAKHKKCQKDEVILAQGAQSHSLFQIARGAVRVEIHTQNEKGEPVTRIGRTMLEGEFFGEMAYLEGGVASASCVADSPDCEVYVIDGAVVEQLLQVEQGLPARLYKLLASHLANRLRSA
eukprot:TRINITY_DN397_c0_g2_i1.p1 TRINITY_DN397_c0_g2~~TRINITY_DN397_c0_g2_i1.p1  ORF type:complete len:968 (-),score=231.30 TRINITY_DN397_c0_g2_i1:146-2641(-)